MGRKQGWASHSLLALMGTPPSPATIARFGEEERQQIAREYLSGARVEIVGKNHGASSVTIRYLLRTMGVPMRKPGEAVSADITGQRFGRLTAIRRTGRRIHGANHEWEFLCDCGNTTYASVHSVRGGNTNSCGCYGKDRIAEEQRKDYTGQRFGRLVALRYHHSERKSSGNLGRSFWEFQCDCGKLHIADIARTKARAKNEADIGCGCVKNQLDQAGIRQKDYKGLRVGSLVAIHRVKTISSGGSLWLWQCDCGETCERSPASVIRSTGTPSCGCKRGAKRIADRTGERFGSLVAIKNLGKKPGEKTYTWLFQCDCGNTCEARLRDAVSGLQKSCGCRQGGYDSIAAWLEGEFRNAEQDAYFYVFPLSRFPGYAKPGIAEDLEARRKGSRGEYGELYDFIECHRLDAWLLEQAVLRTTLHAASCPDALRDSKWEGYSEVRLLRPEVLFDYAIRLHSDLQELGREEFAIRHLVTTPAERRLLKARSNSSRGAE